jgi:hypothetical protein
LTASYADGASTIFTENTGFPAGGGLELSFEHPPPAMRKTIATSTVSAEITFFDLIILSDI